MSPVSSPAKWSPDVVGLYDDDIPDYVRSLPSPIRQRQAGDLLTKLTEVHSNSYPYNIHSNVCKTDPSYNAYERDIAVVNIFHGDSSATGT